MFLGEFVGKERAVLISLKHLQFFPYFSTNKKLKICTNRYKYGNSDEYSNLSIGYISKFCNSKSTLHYWDCSLRYNFQSPILKKLQKIGEKCFLSKYHLWHIIENVIWSGIPIWHLKLFLETQLLKLLFPLGALVFLGAGG